MIRYSFTLLLLIAAGCTPGPVFHRPAEKLPDRYEPVPQDVVSKAVATSIDAEWWQSFGDPILSSLIDRAVRQNLDLAAAAERIGQASAQRAVVASQGLPHLDARGTYVHERESKNGELSLLTPAPGAPLEFNQWDVSLMASWELDLAGRVRRAVEAANANTTATIEARRSVALRTIADTAQAYLQLRGVQAREELTQRYLDVANQRRELTRQRFNNQVATRLEVAQADAQASTIAEDLPTLRSNEAKLINIIGLLLSEPPRTLAQELAPRTSQPLVPPSVPIGLPGELLRRRPDIREAEARLHEATANTGVAVAAFYPDISLTGSLGTESLSAYTLFDWSSRMFTIGPTVQIPIFEGGRLRGTLHLREAAQREAAIAYRKSVLQARHDVDNAMTAYVEMQHREAAVANAAREDETVLQLAQQRYEQGVADFLDVTSAQASLLQADDALARVRTDVATTLVDLYKSLGGGWNVAEFADTRR